MAAPHSVDPAQLAEQLASASRSFTSDRARALAVSTHPLIAESGEFAVDAPVV
jgi:hypothetical protein